MSQSRPAGEPPFTVLHVCVGNICRSPMAERLLVLELARRVGAGNAHWYRSHGAGTGNWHVGEPINPLAANQLRALGADPDGFRARQLDAAMVDGADLVLCATAEQVRRVLSLRPAASARTFVLGEFGRLLAKLDVVADPVASAQAASAQAAYDRGVALVAAVDALRLTPGSGPVPGSGRRPPLPSDDLDDPWGLPDAAYAATAKRILAVVVPLAQALAP